MSIPAPNHGAIADPGARLPRLIRPFLFLALIGGALIGPTAALADAELDTATPADKSTVQGSPTEIVMTFTQHLDPAKSSIRLVDAGGTVIAEGSTVDADRTPMRLASASPLAAGVYTTRWTSFSADDAEQDRGTTTFTVVAAPSAAPSSAPSVGPSVGPSAAASIAAPSIVTSVAPSAAPSPAPTTPAASTGDVVIPVAVALIVLVGLGLWLLRGRGRGR